MKIICAVKDLAVQAFGTPFTVSTAAEAIRSFRDEVNRKDGQSAVAAHPEDYELYQIADYDEQTGIVHVYVNKEKELKYPELINRAKDLIQGERS